MSNIFKGWKQIIGCKPKIYIFLVYWNTAVVENRIFVEAVIF